MPNTIITAGEAGKKIKEAIEEVLAKHGET